MTTAFSSCAGPAISRSSSRIPTTIRRIEADTADFTYARLQRMREDVPTGYDAEALDAFAERARQWQHGGRDVYIFMINGAKVRAPPRRSRCRSSLDV